MNSPSEVDRTLEVHHHTVVVVVDNPAGRNPEEDLVVDILERSSEGIDCMDRT